MAALTSGIAMYRSLGAQPRIDGEKDDSQALFPLTSDVLDNE